MQNHGVVDNNYLRTPLTKSFVELLPKLYQKVAFVANPALSDSRGYGKGFDEYHVAKPNNKMEEWGQEDISPEAIGWLKTAKEKGNFFLWLHYIDPHGPCLPPPDFHGAFIDDAYYDKSITAPLDYTPEPGINENYVLGAIPKYQRLKDINVVDYYIAEYDAEIKYTDTEVGKVLDYLNSSGLTDNTIVIITADHGESLGDNNYYFEHGMLVNEASIHIPLIISHPDIKTNLTFDTLMQSIDIAPTLLDFLGIKNSVAPTDGISFSKLIYQKNTKDDLRQYIYSCTPYGYNSFYETIRGKGNKIVRKNEKEYSYYNLISDQQEIKNLYNESEGENIDEYKSVLSGFGKSARVTPILESNLSKAESDKLKTLGYTK
jgi:arylsulfatase A-like enzyme